MCAKVISVSYTCWATYSNPKTTPGQEVHKFYPFQALFWLTGGFQKYQTKVANFAPHLGGPTAECFQLQEASPPEPMTRGSDPTGGSAPDPRYRLAPTLTMSFTRAFCPPHCFRPGDAPECKSLINCRL